MWKSENLLSDPYFYLNLDLVNLLIWNEASKKKPYPLGLFPRGEYKFTQNPLTPPQATPPIAPLIFLGFFMMKYGQFLISWYYINILRNSLKSILTYNRLIDILI